MLRRNQNLNNKFKIRATRTNKKDEQGNKAKGYLYKEIKEYPYFQGVGDRKEKAS